jgi:hypothetical protein
MFMRPGLALVLLGLQTSLAFARSQPSSNLRPDPLSVQRYGPAYRYPQAGWIVVHIEGGPYERGYQHGRLLAPEIVSYLTCSAMVRGSTAPSDAWKHIRTLVNSLFLRRYESEFLEEMKGIADGAASVGARFDNRPVDLVDIAALNAWPEIDTLDGALEATPTGLEGKRFSYPQSAVKMPPQDMHCSAFAANGKATTDGKIVFGHITMFGLYPSLFYNVWLDIKPAKGHRIVMQSYPGGIQSGMDYYLNDAGLLVAETTIKQTRFDIAGMTEASRIRQAVQYAENIDKAAEILGANNNGLYTNEWLLADIKTNEIAMFELGTAKSKLYRSSKNEWFGGTEGFYWGCNNTKDLEVRLETYPGVNAAPANVVWRPSDRDRTWQELYRRSKGHIDEDFGKVAFTTPPIAACVSLDAKFTTSDMARDLKTWALFGPPLGKSWQPTDDEKKKYPQVHAMASNPWTILEISIPPAAAVGSAVDLHERLESKEHAAEEDEDRAHPVSTPAWFGTLLPQSDADIWLASAFADYERYVSLEDSMRERAKGGKLTSADYDELATLLFSFHSSYSAGARALADAPLADIKSAYDDDSWYRLAAGKGFMLLHELRRRMGNEPFTKLMRNFGKEHAGHAVSTADFIAAAEKQAGQSLKGLFDEWLHRTGLPRFKLQEARIIAEDRSANNPQWRRGGGKAAEYRITGIIRSDNCPCGTPVDVTVDSANGEFTKTVTVEQELTPFSVETDTKPLRVWIDKHTMCPKQNDAPYTVVSFLHDVRKTLIIYGTTDEADSNRETAEVLQRAIVRSWCNCTVPIKSDLEVTDDDLQGNHLLLIGRPSCNVVVKRFEHTFPVAFGTGSFSIRPDSYAHAGSAVIAAAENPKNPRYSLVLLAGLSADSTMQTPKLMLSPAQGQGNLLLAANGEKTRHKVVPAQELVQELTNGAQARK